MEPKTARGHEEPVAEQFSIFLANRVGQLKDILDLLYAQGIILMGVSIVDSTDWAVIRMVLSDPAKAKEVLTANEIPYTESEVLLVVMPEDNSLSTVCGHLLRAEINVHFAYPLTVRRHDAPVLVFHLDDYATAREVLLKHNFILLGSDDLTDQV